MMNNATNCTETSEQDRVYIEYMNDLDNESRIKHLTHLILNTEHGKHFTISIDLLINIMTPANGDYRSAAQSLLMKLKNVDRFRSHLWQWGCDKELGHVYFSASYPTKSELDAFHLHSESKIEQLIPVILSVESGKSFGISIDDLVNTMLLSPDKYYLKAYKIAATRLLIRLNDADRDSGRRMSWCCDEGRRIVYFGVKDHHGRFECSAL